MRGSMVNKKEKSGIKKGLKPTFFDQNSRGDSDHQNDHNEKTHVDQKFN